MIATSHFTERPAVTFERMGLAELVPHYLAPPCPFTKAQAVRFIVSDRLTASCARGKGSKARKRAQKLRSEALKRTKQARGWLTWMEDLEKLKLERASQLDAENTIS